MIVDESINDLWDYPQDDVESEFLHFSLIDDAASAIDFFKASPLVKVAWMFCVTKYPVVREDSDGDSEDNG